MSVRLGAPLPPNSKLWRKFGYIPSVTSSSIEFMRRTSKDVPRRGCSNGYGLTARSGLPRSTIAINLTVTYFLGGLGYIVVGTCSLPLLFVIIARKTLPRR